MKYKLFIFLAIFTFLFFLSINHYFHYLEISEGKDEKEGFVVSQPGILVDENNQIMTCPSLGEFQRGGKCMDLSYIDQNGNIVSNNKLLIHSNYYVDPATGLLQPVPYGYSVNSQQTGFIGNTPINDDVSKLAGLIRDKQNNILTCYPEEVKLGKIKYGGRCMKLKYTDKNNNAINQNVIIDPDYYMDSTTGLPTPITKGYLVNDTQTGYKIDMSYNYSIPSDTTYMTSFPTTSTSQPTIQPGKTSQPTIQPGKMYFPNGDGTASLVDINLYDQTTQYYETGTYDAGPRNYVPNYESSIYVSKLGSQNIQDIKNKDPIYLSGAALGNTFSSYTDLSTLYANDSAKLEATCNKIDPILCASTNSCVLLGGQKCVSGNEYGPKMKSNYSDYMIMNRDYYYYQGKCYGLCSTAPLPTIPAPTTPAPTTPVPTTPAPTTPAPTTPAPTTAARTRLFGDGE